MQISVETDLKWRLDMQKQELNTRADKIKATLDFSMRKLLECQRKFQFSRPGDSYDFALNNLNKRDFDVVVCGEVKQGKTSFINALLGKELLPVEVKIATSQVFRISNSQAESYYLVFDDGGREPISKDELVHYGTEKDEKLVNDPLMRGRSLRWIEVNIPAAFLPENVHLLDTPGLGALYHSHALITHKYAATADAVLFLKASKDPLVDSERDFLKKMFAVTNNIMFVQTKTDQVSEEDRFTLAKRNEEILNREFSQAARRQLLFWPVSSKNLMDAAKESDPDYRVILKEASGFDKMLEGLNALVFRAVGYSGACVACHEAFRYYQDVALFVVEQRKMLTATDRAEKQKMQKDKLAKEQEFNRKWGAGGSELKCVNEEINQIIISGQQMVQGVFAPGGAVRRIFVDEIKELPNNLPAISAYGQKLPGRLQELVIQKWHDVGTQTQQKLGEVFFKFRTQIEFAGQADAMCTSLSAVSLNDVTTFNKVRSVFQGGTLGGSIGTALMFLLGLGAGGAALLVPVIGFIMGALSGKSDAEKLKAESDKRALEGYVISAMNEMQAALMYPSQTGAKSPMQDFFSGLKDNVYAACEKISESERKRLQCELIELERQSAMNVEDAQKKLEQLDELLPRLDEIKGDLILARDDLLSINKSLVF